MEKKNQTRKYQIKKQDLLDKLAELADSLSAGRRIDPNTAQVKMQLEAIQVEIQSLQAKMGKEKGS